MLGGLPSGLLLFEDRGQHGEDLVQAQRDGVVGVAHEAGDTRVRRTAPHEASVRSMRTST